ncbi:MAG: nucleotidyltransferase domain-containing protein [Candidatus Omnitrophica bacterium]|nr:nucleotidyltransferase domain-containing protein [Candidatus Omnitrophota bacterium]
MKKKNNIDIFATTNTLKVLSFLVENPGKELLGREIQKATSISRAGSYIALRYLIRQKLVLKIKKGKFLMYSVIYDEPIVKQFKVVRTIQLLKPLLEKLRPLSKKIILYGSASRGEDDPLSDIDLFIITKDPDTTKSIISGLKTKRKLQTVIKSPSELADLQDKEKVYYGEVNRGITLWEEKD